jgi:hypothetical protein
MEWIGDLERGFAAAIYPNRVIVAIGGFAFLLVLVAIGRRRGWAAAARRNPRRTAAILAPVLAIALPLSWYLASPLFLTRTLDEPAPTVSVRATTTNHPTLSPTGKPAATARPASPPPSPTAPPFATSGSFAGADDFHFGRGTAHLLETEPGTLVVRLEAFEVRNGPDLHVYLSPSAEGYADGAIELGPLKADKGNQNYAVPAGIDPSSLRSVVIWCKQFSVLFATAPLDP